MKYRPDIEEVLDRYRMWWNREDIGRCAISITASKPLSPDDPPPKIPDKAQDRWLDFDYVKEVCDHRLRNHAYLAEALPIWYGSGYPGWDCLLPFIGCEIKLTDATAWITPKIAGGSLEDYDPDDIVFDIKNSDNEWWLLSQKYHSLTNECAAGKSLPSMPPMGSCGDMLAQYRSAYALLFDVIDSPEMIRKFEKRFMDLVIEQTEHFYNIHKDLCFGGCATFLEMWAPGKFHIASNDFSYMISEKMYEDIYLDQLIRQLDDLDYSIYHVDGPGCFRIVDLLCSLSNLPCLQILPGGGNPSPVHYMDILKKVQAAGKNLHISIPPEDVKIALDNLSTKGLYIQTSCDSVEEGEELLAYVEKNSKFY